MAPRTIPTFHWNVIVDSIRSGKCVPFLGAGVNVSANGYAGLRLGGAVADKLLRALVAELDADVAENDDEDEQEELFQVRSADSLREYPQLLRVGAQDLARVALHVQVMGGSPVLLDLLQRLLPETQREPSPLLEVLARLPVRLIVTTNYDCLMERALTDVKLDNGETATKPIVLVQPTDGFDAEEQAENTRFLSENLPQKGRARDPAEGEPAIVYKIHGSFGDPDRGLVVTEQDYIDFLAAVSRDSTSGVPQQIAGAIQGSHLLFLGYGLEDWDFRTLYKVLVEEQEPNKKRMSFAIQRNPSPFWEELWREKKVQIYDMDLYDFASQLAAKVGLG